MDFDPLSFFEAEKPKKSDLENDISGSRHIPISKQSENINCENFDNEKVDIDTTVQLQVLDLPVILSNIPYSIMTTLLKLFQPEQVKNFGNISEKPTMPSKFDNNDKDQELNEFLFSKSIDIQQLDKLSQFLNHDVESILTLTQLPRIDHSGLTSFLTKIISYPFINYSEEERDKIYDLASHVMTANSAPALKGDTTRVVEIEGLEKDILLYEPALTEDKVGNITWGASLYLAQQIANKNLNTSVWLPKDPQKMEIPILELGAGTGLVTIVLGMLGYKTVSTDLPEIIDNLEKNIELNQLECTKTKLDEQVNVINDPLIHITSLDWRSPNSFLKKTSCENGYKIVLLSDPVYSPAHPYWVRDAVNAVISKSLDAKVVFMIGRRDRFQDVRDCVWNLMIEIGLTLIHSDIVDGFDDYGVLQYDYKVFGWCS
ncbi:hypothetical protein C6P40_001169 [Pichia californica]|uniref:S-adenosylmethionine-dependent methyltransferase n=1 Tax=Pichia californica TaxID=460514 RepID=A0A9P6WLF7_9ASCO|nr:hypothetical protein C6P42_003963 [[Candida] californica]KAG0688282.1 hypothetical protein C6P40_001169 [[Candida] californica]